MDAHLNSNNERRSIQFNLVFFGIFLMEIISGIIGVFMLSIRIDLLMLLFSIIFMSGIYTISKKTLLHLLAFCIINLSPIAVLIGPIINDTTYVKPTQNMNKDTNFEFNVEDLTKTKKFYMVVKIFDNFKQEFQSKYDDSPTLRAALQKEITNKFAIPEIIAVSLILFFDILFIILFIIIWKYKYWDVISYTKVSMPDNLKRPYNIYKSYNFLLYISLCFLLITDIIVVLMNNFFIDIAMRDTGLSGIYTILLFLPLFTLTYSSKIIKNELNNYIFLIYGAHIGQGIVIFFVFIRMFFVVFSLLALSLFLLLVNTILCHLNFGKNLKFYLMFDPDLSNDLIVDDDDDEEEEDDENDSKKLGRYWKTIKSFYIKILNQTKEKNVEQQQQGGA